MEVTEEQKQRAEANRQAALEKRKRLAAGQPPDSWRLSKCPRITPCPSSSAPIPPPPQPVHFRAVLEISSPDEFSVSPEAVKGSPFPGSIHCLQNIEACLSPVMPLCYTEGTSGRTAAVYKLRDYELVSRCLKKLPGVLLQDIPFTTRAAIQKFSGCVGGRWDPYPGLPGFYSEDKVEEYLGRMPKSLLKVLLPFQLEGVRFGLRRGGRCLIADEMGLGKTIQAIAIACCFMNQGPILIVCPAVLRFSWAEELEHWLPFLLPRDIHLVFGHQNNLDRLERSPKVVVISYTMLNRLQKSMLKREWALMIVDESHNIRCTKKKFESEETKAVLEVAKGVSHIILLSGTPSLSRPYDIFHQINMLWPRLLGKDKYEFAKNYCLMRLAQRQKGKPYMDFSKGIRLEELNVLLSQTVMIRRLKEHVLTQLPPKRRQIIRLMLKSADILSATTLCRAHNSEYKDPEQHNEANVAHDKIVSVGEENSSSCHENNCKVTPRSLSHQEIGIAKLSGFRKWFSNLTIVRESDDGSSLEMDFGFSKMIIFAHHLKVLDGIQEIICEKGIQFVRIDGQTLARDRQAAVESFRLSAEVKVAIIGITAGGVGLDFSSAQNVVFMEMPRSASEMLQAEDRAHRRGQTNAVNIYIFCAKDTLDESHWMHLNKSLFRVSSMMNGNDDAIKEIEVDSVFYLSCTSKLSQVASTEKTSTDNMTNGNSGNEQQVADKNSSTETDPKKSEVGKVQCRDWGMYSALDGNIQDADDGNVRIRQCAIVANCMGNEQSVHSNSSKNIVSCALDDIVPTDAKSGPNDFSKAGLDGTDQKESLRFEVSQNTRRIHLYSCIQGMDSRPKPLFQSFRPEELDSLIFSVGDADKEKDSCIWKENPASYNILQTFINEWNGLRPIERNKLLGKPLQLPLSLELCYLKETINHSCGGLLKGGSKRRVTPLTDISRPVPENAMLKKVILHHGLGKEKEYTQAWTASGEPLCKLCQEPCNGNLVMVPEYFEDLFCNLSCFQEYRIRTSQRALREALFQLEHGICTHCKLDCHKLVECIRPLSLERRREYILNVAPKLANKRKLFVKLINKPSEGNAWHADHIIPVHNGGGECSLENMRTLCVVCHSEVTKAQQAEWRLRKKSYKQLIESFVKKVGVDSNSGHNYSTGNKEAGPTEDPLFITVPGSAYSAKAIEVTDNQENECSPTE